jgi:hypothetical protein
LRKSLGVPGSGPAEEPAETDDTDTLTPADDGN